MVIGIVDATGWSLSSAGWFGDVLAHRLVAVRRLQVQLQLPAFSVSEESAMISPPPVPFFQSWMDLV